MSNATANHSAPVPPVHQPEVLVVPSTGWMALAGFLGMLLFGVLMVIMGAISGVEAIAVLGVFLLPIGIIGLFGLIAITPNDSRVLILFGEYRGTVKQSGFFWVNPFYSKRRVSLRIRNFETGSTSTPEKKDSAGTVVQTKSRSAGRPSKVNDRDGNPIEISAVVVWRVTDTAEAMFEVDDYVHFVEVQSEAALRSLATRYPYDSEDHEVSLRGSTEEICGRLREDIQERLQTAGVEVIEARISYLAYAAEIASAMLQRQQAGAVVAARTKIVDGAVGMVDMALEHLKRDNIVDLSEQQRATLVSNLLVVLCSDRHTQPVVQAGS
ncbi:SPFH domain-containing protein [Rhodopirellula sallentina]|uniref:SPFH domain-containing protein n=1 Tax=Rhodopirellula sallentina TaxID=1263869 RepID=UPI000348EDC8|nr:SPFH domain-containing protein [Rhodopirellula sallentina]